jgi:hypothetical protein
MKKIVGLFAKYKLMIGLLVIVWSAWFITNVFQDLSQINADVRIAFMGILSYFAVVIGFLFKD